MRILCSYLLFALLLAACSGEIPHAEGSEAISVTGNSHDTATATVPTQVRTYTADTLPIEAVRLNGDALFLPLDAFRRTATIDSQRSEMWECGSPFDWMDEGKAYETLTHFHTGGAEWISDGHHALLIRADLHAKRLQVPAHSITLTSGTTLDDLKRLFPAALDGYGEGRLDEEGFHRIHIPMTSNEDAWIFFFRNGRLEHVELWWLLC